MQTYSQAKGDLYMETRKTNEEKDSSKVKGGFARAASLSGARKSDIARKAAESRWGQSLPKAIVDGQIIIAGREINCAVLETGKRLLTQSSFLTAVGRSPNARAGTGIMSHDNLPSFLASDNLKPFITDEILISTTPIAYLTTRGQRSLGYDALLLSMVCEVYLKARDEDKLYKSQYHLGKTCDILMRGFARVGIIALVDEATGYEDLKTKRELNKILEAYIVPELRPYMSMFPPEFLKQIYRLHGWDYKDGKTTTPRYVGKFINKYIYEQLPPGVLPELQRKNPSEKGQRKHKHSQYLTEQTGIPVLDKQISNVTMLMRIAREKKEFADLFDRAYAKYYQNRLPLIIDVLPETKD